MNNGDASRAQNEPAGSPPPVDTPPHVLAPRSFSVKIIVIIFGLALSAFVHRNWSYLTHEPIARLNYPGTAALWILHESMMFEDGIKSLPHGAKFFVSVTGLHGDDGPKVCEEALRDAIEHSDSFEYDTTTADDLRAHLAVLLAEEGFMTNAMKELPFLSRSEEATRFRQTFTTAYATEISWRGWSGGGAEPEPSLVSGWAAWRLAARWMQAVGDQDKLRQHHASLAYWQRRIVAMSIAIFGLAWLAQLAGLGSLGILMFKKPFARQPAMGFQGPPWSVKEYWYLFALGLLIAMVAEYFSVWLPIVGQLAWYCHGLCWLVPILVLLAWRHWLRNPASFRLFFGIPNRPEDAAWLALATLALFGAAWLALGWVFTSVEALGFKSHWAEGFDEVLRTESNYARALNMLDGIIFGPVMEEILFRGLLFGALRTQVSFYPAAALSALVFGGNHFYGLAGFLSVSLLGFCCAWARERTGSLLPPIAAHVLTNAFLIGGQGLISSQM